MWDRWLKQANQTFHFFCPQCRAERRLPGTPRIQARHWIQIALTTGVLTLALYPWLEWKGLVTFVPTWTLFEYIFRTRVRVALACPYCGFDPFLYMRDVKKARSEMVRFSRAKYEARGVPYPEDVLAGKTQAAPANAVPVKAAIESAVSQRKIT